MVANTKDVELMVKSDRSKTTDNDVLYYTERYALYARYTYIVANKEYSSTVFITYLFEYKRNSETGELTITENKNINDVTDSDIDNAISADYTIRANVINGNSLVNAKLNGILHYDGLSYKFDPTRESTYTIMPNAGSSSGGGGDDPTGFVDFYVRG